MSTAEEIIQREKQFLLQTYNRYPIVIERGKGVFLFDLDGNKYLDFVAGLGVNALGHAHPRIVKVIRQQSGRAIHLSNLYYNEYQGRLAEKLCNLSGLHRAFFSNSDTEAIEVPSSWHGLLDMVWEARPKANWSRWKALTTAAVLDPCR